MSQIVFGIIIISLVRNFMIVIKIIRNLHGFKEYQRLSRFFGTHNSDRTPNTQIYNKIVKADQVNAFLNVFKQHRQQFDAKLVLSTTNHLYKLMNKVSLRFDHANARIFLQDIDKLDLSIASADGTLQFKVELIQLKRLINLFENQRYFSIPLSRQKTVIASKLLQKIKDESLQIGQKWRIVLLTYNVFALDQLAILTKELIPKLYFTYHEFIKQNENIPLEHINQFMESLLARQATTYYETVLRNQILKRIDQNIDKIELPKLLDIALVLNQIDHYDFEFHEKEATLKIFKKIQTSLKDMTEKDISRLINTPHNLYNTVNMHLVYKEVVKLLFSQIDSQGKTTLRIPFLLSAINKLDQKIKLRVVQQELVTNIFNFLQRVVKRYLNHKDIYVITRIMSSMLEDKFIQETQRKLFDKICKLLKNNVHVNLIYQMQLNRYSIDHLISQVEVRSQKLTLEYMFKYAVVIKKYLQRKNSHFLKNMLEMLEQQIDRLQLFKKQQHFKKMFKNMLIIDPKCDILSQFNRYFPKYLYELPSPYDSQEVDEDYLILFTSYLYTIKHPDLAYLQSYRQKSYKYFQNELLAQKFFSYELSQTKQEMVVNRDMVNILWQNFDQYIKSDNTRFLRDFFRIFIRYTRFIIYNDMNVYAKEELWKLLMGVTKHFKRFNSMEVKLDIYRVYAGLIGKKYKNYTYSLKYQELICVLLKNLTFFEEKAWIQGAIIEEGLKYNLATKPDLSGSNIQGLLRTRNESLRIKYKTIVDDSFKIGHKENQIKFLEGLVYNKHSQDFLSANLGQVQKKISGLANREIQDILLNINLSPGRTSRALQKICLKNLIDGSRSMEYLNIYGIFNKSLKQYTFMITQYGILFDKVVQYYSGYRLRFNGLDYNTIIQMIRFLTTQQINTIKTSQLFWEIVTNYIKNTTANNKLLILAALSNSWYKFDPSDLTIIDKMLMRHPRYAVKYFLMLEGMFSKEQCSRIVKSIVSVFMKECQGPLINACLHDVTLRYLQLTYPEETAQIRIKPQALLNYKFTTTNHTILSILTQMSSILNILLEKLEQTGKNELYNFNNNLIVFTSPLKTTAIYQNRFIQKSLRVFRGMSIPVFIIPNNVNTLDKYIKIITKEGLLMNKQQLKLVCQKSDKIRKIVSNEPSASQSKTKKDRIPLVK